MSILVIALCQTRASHLTAESWAHNLLDSLNADLALCVCSQNGEDVSGMLYRRARYIWAEPEPKDWIGVIDAIGHDFGTGLAWRKLLNIPSHWLGPMQPGSGAILWYFRWRLYFHLKQLVRLRQYDWVILTRSDFIFAVPHINPHDLNPGLFYVPDGERYGGITDRHLIATMPRLLQLLESIHDIWLNSDDLYDSMVGRRNWNPERFLLHQIARKGYLHLLSFVPYAMYCVRDQNTATRWSHGKYDSQLKLFLKYPSEFQLAQQWVSRIYSPADWIPVLCRQQLKT